ncbi:MAG: DUF4406 domain-containing protein [bacterium]
MSIERRRLRVYVAGPISSDVFEGVHRGMRAGRQLFLDGLAPYVPHWDALLFLPEGNWKPYLEWDLEYVALMEAVWRLEGESAGADLECDRALALGIPVFYEGDEDMVDEYEDLLDFAALQGLRGKQVATA